MKKLKKSLILLLIVFVWDGNVSAQMHKVEASFVVNFLRYIQWPETGSGEEFVIGVYGEDPIFESLMKLANGQKFGYLTAKVKRLASKEEVIGCQILFIPQGSVGSVNKILKMNPTAPILVVTEEPEFVPSNSIINFTVANSRLAFKLNQKKATSRQLKVSSKLINMAMK